MRGLLFAMPLLILAACAADPDAGTDGGGQGVRVDPIDGPSVPMARLLAESVTAELQALKVPATIAWPSTSRFVLKGRAEANRTDPGVPFIVLIHWTLSDRSGRRVSSFTQGVRGTWMQWEYGDPKIIRSVGSGAAKSIAAIIGDEGAPGPGPLKTGLLVRPVQGAGGESLTRAIKEALRAADVSITEDTRQAALVLEGRVAAAASLGGRRRITIVWIVFTTDGDQVGRATQENTVPDGSLASAAEAEKVARAAVEGITTILAEVGGVTSARSGRASPGPALSPSTPALPRIPGRAPPPF